MEINRRTHDRPAPETLGKPGAAIISRLVAFGFVAGALAVPLFHQSALAGLDAMGFINAKPYPTGTVGPLGLPQIVSTAFWGGLWGIALALFLRQFAWSTAHYWLLALLVGAVAPSLVAWFIVAPLKGLPLFAGGNPKGIATALIVNGAWAIGTALLLRFFAPGALRPAAR